MQQTSSTEVRVQGRKTGRRVEEAVAEGVRLSPSRKRHFLLVLIAMLLPHPAIAQHDLENITLCDDAWGQVDVKIVTSPSFSGSTSAMFLERSSLFRSILHKNFPCLVSTTNRRSFNLEMQFALDEYADLAGALGTSVADTAYRSQTYTSWENQQKSGQPKAMRTTLSGVAIRIDNGTAICQIKYTANDFCVDSVVQWVASKAVDASGLNWMLFESLFQTYSGLAPRIYNKDSVYLAEIKKVRQCKGARSTIQKINTHLDELSKRIGLCATVAKSLDPADRIPVRDCHHFRGQSYPSALTCDNRKK
jgi:hypothetical protein